MTDITTQLAASPTRFDAYEIHGIAIVDIYGSYEPVDDAKAERFAFFGHVTGEGLHFLGDFETRREAQTLMDRITGQASNPFSPTEWHSLLQVADYLSSNEQGEYVDPLFDHREALNQLVGSA